MLSCILIMYLFSSGDGIVGRKGSVGSLYSESEGIYCLVVALAMSISPLQPLACNTEQ